MENVVYLDNAATTRIKSEVFVAMQPYFETEYANPASNYKIAVDVNIAVENARQTIATFIGAQPQEIYFTGGGSESDNWAIKGIASALKDKGNHIITSKIEHNAVLRTCEYLERHGYEVTYLDVDDKGFVDPGQLEAAIRPNTILISVMFANNEIGTIEPVKEISKIAHAHGVLFHTDAVQAYGHIPINVNDLGIDLMSISGHKINGPKGIGFLYIRNGIKIDPLIHGGSQEQAERVAWRIVKDWLGAQLAILETEMVPVQQVFLPYFVNRQGQTLYEVYSSGALMLEG